MSYELSSSTRVAVIGAGSMGSGIAQLAAQSGHQVLLHDAQPGAGERGLERIAADLDGAVKRGKLADLDRTMILGRIRVAGCLEELEGSGLVVEAIVERLEPKQSLFRTLEPLLSSQAVLATNTSSISVTAVAQGLHHPERVIGWHFFNPAPRMKLVEIIRGVETDPALASALRDLSNAWGKTAVDAPNTPGFIVNRVARPYYAEALRLLAEGVAEASVVDRLLREAGGFAMGPFELMDLIGLDVNLSVSESVFHATAYDPRYAPSILQQELVRSGRLGRKSGCGFYRYGDASEPGIVDTIAPTTAIEPIRVPTELGLLDPLVERLRLAGSVIVQHSQSIHEGLEFGSVRVALTDGRTAAECSAQDGPGLILLDLALDFGKTALIGVTADAAALPHVGALAASLAPAGIALVALEDVAGLVVMRTVCCLANEAADVMTWTGAKAADIDTAMQLGTAYPRGPLSWADGLGCSRVAAVLTHLQAHYGETRYRRAPALSRRHFSRGAFHE
ncbi:3-hydroxyacyl-CoA dehydrogenase [Methylibium sp.]|uniref:3-hydroxyacyl-CoA dehydrogenase n=1 Tax=Methylibium sp. TaxID=2067992 RepID=UPI003D13252A